MSLAPSLVTEAACAKVNLTLHVTGCRPDGYHDLESLVVFAALHDTLIAETSETLTLTLEGPTAGALAGESPADNIVLRAARMLARAGGVPPVARLRLIKRLPVAAGIGGGSADGAAALRALLRLWQISLPADTLNALARDLGADVPVCLEGRAVTMTGVGEVLTPAPTLPPAALVLVNPRKPVATPAVFKARTGPFSPAAPLTEAPATAQDLADALARRTNDLAAPARALEPAIDTVLAALEASAGVLLARMSGSGATCFGLYASLEEAEAAALALGAAHPEWWVAASPLVDDTRAVTPVL
ncbi:4-(cytidine 5'-diphospho)-2-C-methyl-D-erythritol kinase [Pararhodospirillum photometricum]|nr:4-(cytidine 5'-diphospho)-2-C-methyl-D-erythritol kinase [Pararhodospirillum photometricum]